MRQGSRDGLRIVDFGGGDGGVSLELIRALGCKSSYLAVVDFNTILHPAPPPGVKIEHFQTLAQIRESPPSDVVVASAVLEHVKPLRDTLMALFQAVAPGGTFYARTPYVVPLHRALHFAGVKFDTNFPAHLYDLGPEFWQRSISTLGLGSEYSIIASRPSLVESEWRTSPLTKLAATLLKFPWKLVGNLYPWVGGWEVFIRRAVG